MVFVTSDWEGFEDYAKNCRVGTFQQTETVDGAEVRVKAGQFGYKATLDMKKPEDAARLTRILKFCELQGFITVTGSVPDEFFHS